MKKIVIISSVIFLISLNRVRCMELNDDRYPNKNEAHSNYTLVEEEEEKCARALAGLKDTVIPEMSIMRKKTNQPSELTPPENLTPKRKKYQRKNWKNHTPEDIKALVEDRNLSHSAKPKQQKRAKNNQSVDYNISQISAEEIQEIIPCNTALEKGLKIGTITTFNITRMRNYIKREVKAQVYSAFKDNDRPLQYIYRPHVVQRAIWYLCTLCDHAAFERFREVENHMNINHQRILEINQTKLKNHIKNLISGGKEVEKQL